MVFNAMPLDYKRYVCFMCGANFDLDTRSIRSVLFDGSNRPPRWRVVSANGHVLHRCGIGPLDTVSLERVFRET